jgi:hypothetical protein
MIVNLTRYRGADRESYETMWLHLEGLAEPVRASFRYLPELTARPVARIAIFGRGDRKFRTGRTGERIGKRRRPRNGENYERGQAGHGQRSARGPTPGVDHRTFGRKSGLGKTQNARFWSAGFRVR